MITNTNSIEIGKTESIGATKMINEAYLPKVKRGYKYLVSIEYLPEDNKGGCDMKVLLNNKEQREVKILLYELYGRRGRKGIDTILRTINND